MSLPTTVTFAGPTRLALSFLEAARRGALSYPQATWDNFFWYNTIQCNEARLEYRYADGREKIEVEFTFICNGSVLAVVWLEGLRPSRGDDTSIAWAVSAFSYVLAWDGDQSVGSEHHYGRTLRPIGHVVP